MRTVQKACLRLGPMGDGGLHLGVGWKHGGVGPSPKKCRAEAREGIAMLSYNAVSWVLHNNPGFADVCFF